MTTKDVLSEGELDALMDSVSSGEVPLDDGSAGQGCQSFDFNTREQTLLAQMPALKTLNEKQSLALIQCFKDLYKIAPEVEVVDIKLVKLDQVIASVVAPAGINLVKIAPLNNVSYVVFPGELLSFFVDQYFGGRPGQTEDKPSRIILTASEKRINDVLIDRFLMTLQQAWMEKIVLTPVVESFETKPDFLQAASPDELALHFPFVVKWGEWQSAIDWIVPYASLEPLRSKLAGPTGEAKPRRANPNWEGHFRNELLSVEVELSGLYISKTVSISEVLNFKRGSIVPLKTPNEVMVYVEGQLFSSGEHGVLNGYKSIKLLEICGRERSS